MSAAERAWRYFASMNPPLGPWRRSARKAIMDVLDVMRRLDPTGEEDVLARCDKAYPFGPRKNFPYKAWLSERKLLKQGLGLEKASPLAGVLTPLFERKVDG